MTYIFHLPVLELKEWISFSQYDFYEANSQIECYFDLNGKYQATFLRVSQKVHHDRDFDLA